MDQPTVTENLTDEEIAEAMQRARAVACSPLDDRCFDFPDPAAHARHQCTPKGRCRIGWITRASGRESWDVWLDVATGEGRLRQHR